MAIVARPSSRNRSTARNTSVTRTIQAGTRRTVKGLEYPDLRAAPHQFAWTLEGSSESAIITDTGGVIAYVNPAFEASTGYARIEAIGRTPAILRSGAHGPDFFRRLWDTLHAAKEFRGTLINRRKNGDLFYEEKIIRPLFDKSGRMTHFLSEGHDVSERVRTFEKLAYAATHDCLTGLPNRHVFFDRLGQAVRHSARTGDEFSVAILDVDRFKAVNDTFGHAIGDAVLSAVAARLVHTLRDADTVARLGGDEFGLLLLDTADGARTQRVLQHIVDAFVPAIPVPGTVVRVSISIGACRYPADADEQQALMKCADEAMYSAKRTGGNACRMSGDPAQRLRASASAPQVLSTHRALDAHDDSRSARADRKRPSRCG